MRFIKIAMVSILTILVGCSRLQWPPEEQVKGQGSAKTRITPLVNGFSDIPIDGIVRVKRGDTLFIISRRYGVPSQIIIAKNDLKPPYRLRHGSSLKLPRPQVHVVESGDSLYGIARRYGINFYELARSNRLRAPYRIFPSQKLILSYFEASEASVNLVVKKQKKTITPIKRNQAPSRNNEKVKKKVNLNSTLPRLKKEKSSSSQLKSMAIPRIKTSGRFDWPVRGRLSSVYGAKGQGLHNDGINIIAPRGTAVRAADSGIVVYAGNELRGFGNLLLIKHPGGWVTAYAHNDALIVKRRDKVKKGQIVAKVGASGNVVEPQLHFEIRKGKRAINPLRHLKRLSVSIVDDTTIFL